MTVGLRPVDEGDLALLAAWRADPDHEGEYGDFLALHRRADRLRERWEEDGLLSEDAGALMVTRDGEPVGAVQ